MWKMGRNISSLLQKLLLETRLKPSALLPFESTSMGMLKKTKWESGNKSGKLYTTGLNKTYIACGNICTCLKEKWKMEVKIEGR